MILDQAEYRFVFNVFVNSSRTELRLFQAEVDGIRLEYWRGTFFVNGSQIAVFGKSSTACQVTAGGIFRALEKAARDKDHDDLSPVLPELLVTG